MGDRERILARRAMFVAATLAGVAAASPSAAGGGGAGVGGEGAGGSGGVAGFGGAAAGGAGGDGGTPQPCLSPGPTGAGGGGGHTAPKSVVVDGCGCNIPRSADDDMVFLIGLGAALAALRRRQR